MLATDALIRGGGKLAPVSRRDDDRARTTVLPATWSHGNPIDIIGDAPPERYAAALEILARDPDSDGLLVILTPQAMTDPTTTAQQLVPFAQSAGKPVLASWMGGSDVATGERILQRGGHRDLPVPRQRGAHVHRARGRTARTSTSLYETPGLPPTGVRRPQRDQARELIEQARAAGRTILTEPESKELLAAYGIPVAETRTAASEEEAVVAAEAIGYPVVVKLVSHTITHKTDVGGVRLNLPDADAVRAGLRGHPVGRGRRSTGPSTSRASRSSR